MVLSNTLRIFFRQQEMYYYQLQLNEQIKKTRLKELENYFRKQGIENNQLRLRLRLLGRKT